MFQPINEAIIAALKAITGENFVFFDAENLEKYAHDETEDLRYYPEIVVKPALRKKLQLF